MLYLGDGVNLYAGHPVVACIPVCRKIPLCVGYQISDLEVYDIGNIRDGVLMSIGDVYSFRATIRNPVRDISGVLDLGLQI